MRNIPPTALQRKLALRGAGEEEIAAWYAAPPLAQRNWAMHCGIHGLFGYSQDSEEDDEQPDGGLHHGRGRIASERAPRRTHDGGVDEELEGKAP